MYVQNRKSGGGEEETESNYYTCIQDYKKNIPKTFVYEAVGDRCSGPVTNLTLSTVLRM